MSVMDSSIWFRIDHIKEKMNKEDIPIVGISMRIYLYFILIK